jgi:hypothetical protein
VKSGGDVDITKLPSLLCSHKSKPYLAAVPPDLWFREKWPKSSKRAGNIYFFTPLLDNSGCQIRFLNRGGKLYARHLRGGSLFTDAVSKTEAGVLVSLDRL